MMMMIGKLIYICIYSYNSTVIRYNNIQIHLHILRAYLFFVQFWEDRHTHTHTHTHTHIYIYIYIYIATCLTAREVNNFKFADAQKVKIVFN